MRYFRRPARVPHALPSERGFLELAGRDQNLPLRDAFIRFRDLVSADMDWADSRKVRNRQRAWRTKVTALVLTAASTVVLGIPVIPERAAIALPMVALVTVVGVLEAYFNWRSLWVLMEEAQYRLNRIRDEMDYYIVTTPTADLDLNRLRKFFDEQQEIWHDVSRRWVDFRRTDQSQSGSSVPPGFWACTVTAGLAAAGGGARPRHVIQPGQQPGLLNIVYLGQTWNLG